MKFKNYLRKRFQSVLETIQNDLNQVEKNGRSKDDPIKLFNGAPRNRTRNNNRDRASRPHYQLGIAEVVFYPFALTLMVLSFFYQGYEVLFLFGCTLLCSLLIKSLITRLIVLFTISLSVLTLFILETHYFDPAAIVNFMFGINEISLVPSIIGTLMAFIAMGGGIIHGLVGDKKYSGFWILGIATVITIGDLLVATTILGLGTWYLMACIHFGVYLSCFLVTWGGFYVVARIIRHGVKIALK